MSVDLPRLQVAIKAAMMEMSSFMCAIDLSMPTESVSQTGLSTCQPFNSNVYDSCNCGYTAPLCATATQPEFERVG